MGSSVAYENWKSIGISSIFMSAVIKRSWRLIALKSAERTRVPICLAKTAQHVSPSSRKISATVASAEEFRNEGKVKTRMAWTSWDARDRTASRSINADRRKTRRNVARHPSAITITTSITRRASNMAIMQWRNTIRLIIDASVHLSSLAEIAKSL